jgi:uncharacterized membrane protein (UPF0127 family)
MRAVVNEHGPDMRRLALLLGFWAQVTGAQAACLPDQVEFGSQARFTVEIADTAPERSTGLLNRAAMGSGQGMLFVYDAPGHPHFWMKDTLIGLDMIFLAPDGVVTRVHSNAVPLDETAIDGGPGVQYVLEINGGLAKAVGIAPGQAMRWSGLTDPAAPCN